MVDRCDSKEQQTLSDADAVRPDVVIHPASGKHVVVDGRRRWSPI